MAALVETRSIDWVMLVIEPTVLLAHLYEAIIVESLLQARCVKPCRPCIRQAISSRSCRGAELPFCFLLTCPPVCTHQQNFIPIHRSRARPVRCGFCAFAPALGAGGRWFESSRPDQQFGTFLLGTCGHTHFSLFNWIWSMSSIKRDVKKKLLPRPEARRLLSRNPAHCLRYPLDSIERGALVGLLFPRVHFSVSDDANES